jgi:outer membrane lipoprotein LolB
MLQSCVSIPLTKPIDQANSLSLNQQHLNNLLTINQFTLQGRIGVQYDGKGFSGGLHWQHLLAGDNVSLFSPLGGQVASIKKTADKVTLEDANGNSISATDIESLTQSTLGWQLPLVGLADWSLGRPTNSKIEAITWDTLGHLSTLKQDGWTIEYLNYAEQDGHFLPSKITLRSNNVYLKLLVEKWALISQP